jgi:hypothetical protein
MSGELVHSNPNTLPVIQNGSRLPAKVERQTRQGLAEAASNAIVNAGKIEAASFVANVALTQAAMLHHQAAALSAQDPIAADDFAGILTDFVHVARATLRRMAR